MNKINNRRKTKKRNIRKGFNEQSNYRNELVCLKRKITAYQEQKSALTKILDVVRDQIVKVEVEGLQLAANKRQEEEDIESNDDMKSDNIEFPTNQTYFENIDEINNSELKLEGGLDEMFSESHCLETEEDDDPLDIIHLQG